MELKNQPNIENEYYDSKQKICNGCCRKKSEGNIFFQICNGLFFQICNIGTDPCGRERVRNKETSFFFRSPE
ncbi:hypothetical protein HanIR_Chr17g0877621 [Helianthus annuus]|nr:hypothetical protein HanIR_Chr17g0877621 [Helianthus annuus]